MRRLPRSELHIIILAVLSVLGILFYTASGLAGLRLLWVDFGMATFFLFIPPVLYTRFTRLRQRKVSASVISAVVVSTVLFSVLMHMDTATALPDTFYLHDVATSGISPSGRYMNSTQGSSGATMTFDTLYQNAYWYADETWPSGGNDMVIDEGAYSFKMYFNELPRPWWNTSYLYRQKITVTAGASAIPASYGVNLSFAHNSLVLAGQAQADGDDVRVVYWTGSSWVERARAMDDNSSWDSASTKIWWETYTSIAASGSDQDYYLYYGNTSAANPPTSAAKGTGVKYVQSGTTTSSANGIVNVPISPVNTSKSFLIFGSRHNSNRPVGSYLRGQIYNSTTVQFERVTNEAPPVTMTINWYVVEYYSGVNVQRGEASMTSDPRDITIGAVSALDQAFVTWSKTPTNTDNSFDSNDPQRCWLTTTTNLRCTGSASSTHIVWWQVIEFTNAADIDVQAGTVNLWNGATSASDTLSPGVGTTRTFFLAGYNTSGGGADVGSRMLRANLTSSTGITIDRSIGGNADDVTATWQSVELFDGTRVFYSNRNFGSGISQQTVNIGAAVDLNRSVAFASVQPAGGQNMGRSPYSGDDIIGVGSFTINFTSTTQINLTRDNTASSSDVVWMVVEFEREKAMSSLGGEETSANLQIVVSVYHTKADGTDAQEIVTSSAVTIDNSTADPLTIDLGTGARQTFSASDPRRLRLRVNVTAISGGERFVLAYDSVADPSNLATPSVFTAALLTNPTLTPGSGSTSTFFNFTIDYTHPLGVPANLVRVNVSDATNATYYNFTMSPTLTPGIEYFVQQYWAINGTVSNFANAQSSSDGGASALLAQMLGFDTGTGADGSVACSATCNINTDVLGSGRSTYADGIVTTVTTNPTGTTISVSSTNGFAANDEILLINLGGASGDAADVGNYELLEVQSVSGGDTITTTTTIQNSYDGTSFANQRVVVQRIPQWTTLTVNSGGTLTANAWGGSSGGVIIFRATGAVTINSGGAISANALGYRGGAGGTSGGSPTGGQNGESFDGYNGAGGNSGQSGTEGGGAGTNNGGNSQGTRGGGGGGGAEATGDSTNAGGGGAGGGYAGGGGGGGGSGDGSAESGNGGTGGGTGTGGGGGGCAPGNDAGGAGGNAGSAGGSSGTGGSACTGGAAGSGGNTGEGGSSAAGDADSGGGGGGGGGLYGLADLSTIFFGSGGGGGGGSNEATQSGSTGGGGGGIIVIIADSVSVSGTLSSNGSAGTGGGASTNPYGASGGGAGGSILIRANSVTNSGTVTAVGGVGGSRSGTSSNGGGGGGGGVGRIRIEADSITGTANPSASTSGTPGQNVLLTQFNTTGIRDGGENTLVLRYNLTSADDTFGLWVWDFTASDWTQRGTLDQTAVSFFNYTLTSDEVSGGVVSIRFNDTSESGTTNLSVDYQLVNNTLWKAGVTYFYNTTLAAGWYEHFFWANDTNGNWNMTSVLPGPSVNAGPTISDFRLENATAVSKTGEQLDVDVDYFFVFNVTDENGWTDIGDDGNVSLRLWYDGNQTPELTYDQQTTGANYRIELKYVDTSDSSAASLGEWSVTEGRATYNASASSLTSITDGYEFKLALRLHYQVKQANDPTNNTVGSYNDDNSWNAEIVAYDGTATSTLQTASTGEHMEFGVYMYTFVNISANWATTLGPGDTQSTNAVTVYYRSNDDFRMRIWFVTHLVDGSNTIDITNVQILAAADPNDNVTSDIQFTGLGIGNAEYIFGSDVWWFAHSTDIDENTVVVQFSVTVPYGTVDGTYTAQLTIRMQQRSA